MSRQDVSEETKQTTAAVCGKCGRPKATPAAVIRVRSGQSDAVHCWSGCELPGSLLTPEEEVGDADYLRERIVKLRRSQSEAGCEVQVIINRVGLGLG